jgi:hypothetical protein
VEGAIITRKIRGDVTGLDPFTPTTAAFHVHTKSTKPPTPKPMVDKNHSACSVKIGDTGLKTAKKLPMSRIVRRS